MPSIQKLSPELIGQIAAGEVVERPASAVKELVENAIDAGATNVTVELREGGVSYLRVSDNGRGIPAEQLRMAFERHATSKLRRADDLFNIHTLGFRGEALASIAAVARVSCTTRTADAAFGTRATVEAAEFTDIRQAASPVGTTIVVEDLFFNTPVRLKFLKKPAMEAAMVADYMLRLILSKPEISFRFVSQGKTVYHSLGDGKAESALFSLYGKDALRQMRRVDGHMNGVLVSGFVGVGELARGNRQQQSFFVNGRYFKSALLSKALENGCEGRVMIGRFPMCALYLQIDYQQVDVNVHPNKLEVRFQNEAGVAQAVQTMVSDALHAENLGATLSAGDVQKKPSPPQPEKTEGFVVVSLGNEEETAPAQAPTPVQETTPVQAPASLTPPAPVCQAAPPPIQPAQVRKPVVLPPVQAPLRMNETVMPRRNAEVLLQRYAEGQSAADAPVPQPAVVSMVQPVATPTPCVQPEEEQTTLLAKMAGEQAPLRLVGIVFDTYWIFEAGEKLLLVDQHAAHERILYDRLMARYEGEHISQRLLSPQLVRLTARDMALALELTPVLAEAGFELAPFDESCIAVHAIPTLFGRNEPAQALLLEALDEWQAGRGQVTRERMRRQIAQMACKHAIKGGDQLNENEMQGLLRDMLQSESMPTCPHGRPIVIEITRYALEKRFKRVQ